jgi:NAD(P)-dependent dehydrogenase (short-subunit alcohol dehydrogenase family)
MPSYEGKVAVITGGASGIGYAIAQRAGAEGMVVVLVDVQASALADACAALVSKGIAVHAFVADVSDREGMLALAQRIADEVGDVWLLVNNAGVFVAAPFLESTPQQWEFVINTNLWGVVHGLQAFLPAMVDRDSGHVVNTSSLDGIVTVPNVASYIASKHAISGLSETLFRELALAGSNVGMSVLCPGTIETNIVRSTRNWPARLGPAPAVELADGFPEFDEVMAPAAVADIVFEAIGERRFWIVTHPGQYASAIRARAEGIITGANPDDASVDPNYTRASGRAPH